MNKLKKNRIGQKSGLLTVVKEGPNDNSGHTRWYCKCSCGNENLILVRSDHLDGQHTRSCDCIRKDPNREDYMPTKFSEHPLARTLNGMKQRCNNPTPKNYNCYAAKGIKVCKRWEDSLVTFIIDAIEMGWKYGKEAHRIDNDGNYEPGNVEFLWPDEHRQKHKIMREKSKIAA